MRVQNRPFPTCEKLPAYGFPTVDIYMNYELEHNAPVRFREIE